MKRSKTTAQTEPTAVLYARVSTEEQGIEGCSLAMQTTKLRAYCELRGLTIVDVIVEAGVSGGTPLESRDGGRRLVEMVKRGQVGHVIALKLDRLFRDCGNCLAVTAEWDKKGIALHLIDLGGQTLDTSSAMGRFFLTVMAGAAELEKNLIGERTAQAMAHKRTQGERISRHVPYGMQLGADGVHLEPCADEQRVIGIARDLHQAGLSSRKIASRLAEQGLYSRAGTVFGAAAILNMVAEG